MKTFKTIMVTGCGGDIGTAIGRILKDLKIAEEIVGIDISADNAGTFVFDTCDTVPRADAPEYFDSLKKIIKKYSPDLVIPMSEAEIRAWYRMGATETIEGVPVIMANTKALETGIDKLKTVELLKSQSLPYPWTSLVQDGAPQELPCVMKNHGLSGKGGIIPVADRAAADYFSAVHPDYIWQESLDGDEYTVGVYGCRDGNVRTIVMRRKLSGSNSGFTVEGEVVEDLEIERVVLAAAHALSLRGSINVQLRMTAKGPCVFEINPRFSSTVMFRHKLGFKDVLWSIEEKMGHALSPYAVPKTGTKFYKGYTEYITA